MLCTRVQNLSLENNKYKFTKANEIFNQYTYEALEFLSLGVFIDINLNVVDANKTEITLEVRRKIGTFNHSHEITKANEHLSKVFDCIAKLTSKSIDEIETLKAPKSVIVPTTITKKDERPLSKKSVLVIASILISSAIIINRNTKPTSSTTISSATTSSATAPPSAPALTQQQLERIETEKAKVAYKEREDKTIKATNITALYEENEVKADEIFKGNTFFVEGIVTDIKKDILDDIYVILEGNEMFRDVQCYFNDKNTAAQLEKGMRVTFQGKCDGLMMNVQMKNCVLVDNLSTLKKGKK